MPPGQVERLVRPDSIPSRVEGIGANAILEPHPASRNPRVVPHLVPVRSPFNPRRMPENEKDHPPRLSFSRSKPGDVLGVGPPPKFSGLPCVRLLLRDKRN